MPDKISFIARFILFAVGHSLFATAWAKKVLHGADTRRLLRRIAEGNLGRFQAPAIEALGGRVSRNLERLTGAIVSAGLIIGGSNMVMSPQIGWHHVLGEMLVGSGVLGSLIISIGALRSDRGRGRGRR